MADAAELAIVSIATFKMTEQRVFPYTITLICKSGHSKTFSSVYRFIIICIFYNCW